jgi:hypothetical protein
MTQRTRSTRETAHRLLGRTHAEAAWRLQALGGTRGQGTVEYVALMLLVAALLTAVVAVAKGVKGDGIAGAIVEKLKDTIESVGGRGRG